MRAKPLTHVDFLDALHREDQRRLRAFAERMALHDMRAMRGVDGSTPEETATSAARAPESA